jgi:hypothetical protein
MASWPPHWRRALGLALLLALLGPFAPAWAQQAGPTSPAARPVPPRALPLEPLRPEEKSSVGPAFAVLGVAALVAGIVIALNKLARIGGGEVRPLDARGRPPVP